LSEFFVQSFYHSQCIKFILIVRPTIEAETLNVSITVTQYKHLKIQAKTNNDFYYMLFKI